VELHAPLSWFEGDEAALDRIGVSSVAEREALQFRMRASRRFPKAGGK